MSVAYAEVLLDAHVHFHDGFSRPVFFDAARRNLAAGAHQLRLAETVARGLMFTESRGVDAFGGLAARADTQPATSEWCFRATAENNSLWAVPPARPPAAAGTSTDERLLLVAGRQLVTREGLEVLALGCREALADGMALGEARDAVIENGGIPVIPWGFGKWWFARGRLVTALIESASPGTWFLGDNAGRPRLSRTPSLFARAAARGVFVLPGSDPLPLAGQDEKPGRCGFHLTAKVDPDRPAASILDALRANDRQPATFGRYEGLGGFVRDQLSMQLRKGGAAGGASGPSSGAPPEPSTGARS
jgi:hypothetical protein